MPIHDWTRVPAGLFHHFQQDWSIEITRELNRGRLPPSLFLDAWNIFCREHFIEVAEMLLEIG
jgi:hypothetical protein